MLNLEKETLNFLEDHISIMLRSCPKNFGIFLYHGMGVAAGWGNELTKKGIISCRDETKGRIMQRVH